MIYGLYLSAQGAESQMQRLDVVANNLANGSTTGFKRDLALFREHHPFDVRHGVADELEGNLNSSTGGNTIGEVATDFADGPLLTTGGTYDLALSGQGFFQVTDGQQNFLTRNGSFTVDQSGQLVSQSTGHAVLDESGAPIQIPAEASDVLIASDGTLTQVLPDGSASPFGQLGVFQPRSLDELVKIGNSHYQARSVQPAGSEVSIKQGYLEGSATEPVQEMLAMIEASRHFESNMNMIKHQDDALGQLLQAVAR